MVGGRGEGEGEREIRSQMGSKEVKVLILQLGLFAPTEVLEIKI